MTEPRLGHDYLSNLAMPEIASWPIFPFKGEMQVRTVRPFEAQDWPRNGEPGAEPCHCESDDGNTWPQIWSDERWVVRPLQFRPGHAPPVPAYMLSTVEHMDMTDFDDEYAADMGLITLRLMRAIHAIGQIGRVHVNRWGDGGSHFHMWFIGRPLGAWQLSGVAMPIWGHILPSLPDDVLAAQHQIVTSALNT